MKEVFVGKRNYWENSISKGDLVLDIGCWRGAKVSELRKRGVNAFGMDIDEEKLKMSDKKLNLKQGDVTKKIPFNRKFDWVIFGEVLEHISNDELALKNISKSLKNGGKLILSTPRNVPFFEFWDPAWVRWKFLGGQRHHHYTQKELWDKMKRNGLEVKEYYVIGNFIWVLNRWINVFLQYLFRLNKISFSKELKGFCDWVILAEKVG
ncbi:MAG: class I SAM-dependent methyltransferase [Nanoarchaeota archaeon]|nr:class I SAM-dependent methyltransferase [Nanoarchaeota archaeon]